MATMALVAAAALAVPPVVGGHAAGPSASLAPIDFRPLLPTDASLGVTADSSLRDLGRLEPGAVLTEPAASPRPASRAARVAPVTTPGSEAIATPTPRPTLRHAAPAPGQTAAPAVGTIATGTSYIISGWASWYDNGTTAMRLPRGTRVRVCGPATCLTRIVTDYGPDASIFPNRVVDMMPSDFATVCGCSPSKGTVRVTVTIYA